MNRLPEIILSVILNTFSVFNVIFIMQLFFGLTRCKKRTYLLIGAAFLCLNAVLGTIFRKYEWLELLVIYGYMVFVTVFLAKKERLKTAFYTIPAILLYVQWCAVIGLLDKLCHLENFRVVLNGTPRTPFYLLSDGILFAALLIALYKTGKRGRDIRITFGESLFLIFFCIFEPVIEKTLSMLEDTFHSYAYSVGWVAFILILNAAVFYGIFYRNNARYYKQLSQNYKQQFDDEYTYFKDYKKEQKNVVKFRHDMNNHMLLIQSMLDKQEYEKAKEYFHTLTGEYGIAGHKYLTGNEIVDMLVNMKAGKMEEEEIAFHCNGGLQALSFMKDVDVCTLFSNLIDNAIEACLLCEKDRFLSIRTAQKGDMFVITVSNRMTGTVSMKDGILQSTKKTGTHGIGTQNAFEMIKKYRGEYETHAENDVFSIQMVFTN